MAQSALRDISPTWWKDIAPQAPQKPVGQQMSDVLGGMALATAPIPIVGDVAGAVSDAAMYAAYPEERTMLNAGMSLAGLVPFVPGAGGVRAAEGAMDTYYHGGELAGPINEAGGLFNGIFVSPSKTAAKSHGNSLYSFEIPPAKIAKSGDFMGYSDIPWEQQKASIRRTNSSVDVDGPDFDLWYKAVVDDKADQLDADDLARIFGKEDAGENLWEAQRQRGRLAKELGYDAVEMSDEHGTSVLLVRDRPYSKAEDVAAPSPLEGTLMSQAASKAVKAAEGSKFIDTLPGRNQLNYWVDGGQDAVERGFSEEPFILLDKLYIDPQNRGQGVARKVLEEGLKDMADQHPGMEVRLLAEPLDRSTNLSDLVRLYESVGFDVDNYQEGMSGVPMSMRLPFKPKSK